VKDPLEDRATVGRPLAARALLVTVAGLVVLAIVRPGSRTPLALVGGIVVMIMLHEAGHFVMAKRSGMKVTEFFLGFGPRLWSFRRGETEYGVKAIPAGGYVRIIGMSNLEDVVVEDEHRTFRTARTADRLKVIMAGVTVNALLAVVLIAIAIAGQGGVWDGPSTTVYGVVGGSAAADAGVRPGDRFVAVDGKPVHGWDELKVAIETRARETTTFTVRRDGHLVDLDAMLHQRGGKGFLGVQPITAFRSVGVIGAVPEAFRSVGDIASNTAKSFAHLVSPSGVSTYTKNFTSAAPKKGSAEDQQRLRSLVGIVDEGSSLVGGNIWALLWLLGGISFALALFNVLPLLPFDGGHAAVVVYEAVASRVRGRRVRVDFRKLMPVTAVVLVFFLTIGLSAMLVDVRQAIGQ
jgi:membrane-associated protease RseP (regulator of RpoE activity)